MRDPNEAGAGRTERPPWSLAERFAVVTGAAQNIGLAITRTLAERGATVALLDVNAEGARGAAEALLARGLRAVAWSADVSRPEDVQRVMSEVIDKFGRLDILVNNAGITRDGLLVRMSDDDWARVLAVNLNGCFHCCRAVARQMVRQKSGRIINIASVIGLMGNAGQTNYAASKAGVIGFTKALAKELASRSVTVNAVAPGFIASAMTEVLPAETKALFLSHIPLGWFGHPDDVAHAVAFLASEEARFITGQVLNVDGGMVM